MRQLETTERHADPGRGRLVAPLAAILRTGLPRLARAPRDETPRERGDRA